MTTGENYLVLDDDGMPKAFVDVEKLQAQATRLAYAMAAYCDEPTELDRISAEHLAEAGPAASGYVTAAALQILAGHILAPVLDVTSALYDAGYLVHDLRAGLKDAAQNAEETLQ